MLRIGDMRAVQKALLASAPRPAALRRGTGVTVTVRARRDGASWSATVDVVGGAVPGPVRGLRWLECLPAPGAPAMHTWRLQADALSCCALAERVGRAFGMSALGHLSWSTAPEPVGAPLSERVRDGVVAGSGGDGW